MQNVIETVDHIQEILESIDTSDIDSFTENMSTDFGSALQKAVELKMKGPTFDDFENLVLERPRIPVADVRVKPA